MTILRHTDPDTNMAVELIHGVEVALIDLDSGRVVLRKVFTSLDDRRDARAFFDFHVAALTKIPAGTFA